MGRSRKMKKKIHSSTWTRNAARTGSWAVRWRHLSSGPKTMARYCRPLKKREKTQSHHWAHCWIFSFRKRFSKWNPSVHRVSLLLLVCLPWNVYLCGEVCRKLSMWCMYTCRLSHWRVLCCEQTLWLLVIRWRTTMDHHGAMISHNPVDRLIQSHVFIWWNKKYGTSR